MGGVKMHVFENAVAVVRRSAVGLFAIMAAHLAVHGQAFAGETGPQQILAPAGKLRVGLYPGTPTSILPDSAEPRGVGYDLGKEMAKRLGVPFEPVVFAKNADVLEAVKTGAVDVAFTHATAERAADMDFSEPTMAIGLGYLVPAGSPIAALGDIDRPGVRVGVTEKSSSDAALSHDLKNARVIRTATVKIGTEMLAAGKLDAYATNKATLFEMADALPGSKVLDGQWGVEEHAVAIPKGREQGMAFVQKFSKDVKTEGLVTAAIERAGLRGTVALEAK
jgi:polar amino acid transport system substrate-binding protein